MKKSGQWCVDAVEKLVKFWDDLYYKDKVKFESKRAEAAPDIKDKYDFFEVFTSPAGLVQYGQRSKACQLIQEHVVPKLNDEIEATKAFIKAFSGNDDEMKLKQFDGINILSRLKESSFVEMLKNTTIDYDKMWRQWFYQVCTEVGYF